MGRNELKPRLDKGRRRGNGGTKPTQDMAQPPVTHERRVLYTGFGLPDRNTEAASARARLSAVREAAPVTVSQPPSRKIRD